MTLTSTSGHATTRAVRTRRGRLSVRLDLRSGLVCLALAVATAAVSLVTLATGDFPLPVGEVLGALVGQAPPSTDFIVVGLRLPRLLTALLVGASLAASGAVFQSLTRNPLGSPDIVGFTTGSATGALVVIIVVGGGPAATVVGAILGGLVAALVVYLLAFRHGAQGYRLVLVGIGVAAMLMSANAYLLTRGELAESQSAAAAWLVGSLTGRGWETVVLLLIAVGVLLPATAMLGGRLRMLEMGDEVAGALGLPVESSRLVLVVLGVALCAVGTAAAGPVTFVALAAPQLAKRLTRAPGVSVVSAAFMGALLLAAADLAAQQAIPSTQLPVGVATGALGGCYLAWLLTIRPKVNR